VNTPHRIASKDLLPGDVVHVINPEGEFLENITIRTVEEYRVTYQNSGYAIGSGHQSGNTYILVERKPQLPTEIGAIHKGFIRITKELWVALEPTTDYAGKIHTYSDEEVRV